MNMMFALLDPHPSIPESIVYMLTGFILVVGVLAILSAITSFVGLFFIIKEKAKSTQKEVKAEVKSDAPKSVASSAKSEDAVITAVISAAVFAVLEGNYNILSIDALPSNKDWALEGRKAIFRSHLLKTK